MNLTDRERDVLRGAANGERAWETARRLDIAHQTVKSHRKAILRKLGARSMAQAIALVEPALYTDGRQFDPDPGNVGC